jgi:hypothetical protein
MHHGERECMYVVAVVYDDMTQRARYYEECRASRTRFANAIIRSQEISKILNRE